jgi:hypothetical protein
MFKQSVNTPLLCSTIRYKSYIRRCQLCPHTFAQTSFMFTTRCCCVIARRDDCSTYRKVSSVSMGKLVRCVESLYILVCILRGYKAKSLMRLGQKNQNYAQLINILHLTLLRC